MSQDEVIIAFVCSAVAVVLWGRWFYRVASVRTLGRPASAGVMGGLPFLAGAVLLLVLLTLSSADVQTDLRYITMYLVMGAAWVPMWLAMTWFVGLEPLTDVLERANKAAASATAGAMLGLTLCFAGANIGDGPGWWVVVYSAGLASGAWMFIWGALQLVSGVSDLITIERDRAAGARLFGVLVGAGLICGRGAAGDWNGYGPAAEDFVRTSWPALGLVFFESVATMLLRPRPDRPQPDLLTAGVAPAMVYLALCAWYIVSLGWP